PVRSASANRLRASPISGMSSTSSPTSFGSTRSACRLCGAKYFSASSAERSMTASMVSREWSAYRSRSVSSETRSQSWSRKSRSARDRMVERLMPCRIRAADLGRLREPDASVFVGGRRELAAHVQHGPGGERREEGRGAGVLAGGGVGEDEGLAGVEGEHALGGGLVGVELGLVDQLAGERAGCGVGRVEARGQVRAEERGADHRDVHAERIELPAQT